MVIPGHFSYDILIKATLILSSIQAGLAIYTGTAGILDETTFSAILDLSFGVVFFIWSSLGLFAIWKELSGQIARVFTIVFAASYCILSLFYLSFVFIFINLVQHVSVENQSCRGLTKNKRQFIPHEGRVDKKLGICLVPLNSVSTTTIIDIVRVSLQLAFMIIVAIWSVVHVRRMAKLQDDGKDFQFVRSNNRSSSMKQTVVVEGTQFLTQV